VRDERQQKPAHLDVQLAEVSTFEQPQECLWRSFKALRDFEVRSVWAGPCDSTAMISLVQRAPRGGLALAHGRKAPLRRPSSPPWRVARGAQRISLGSTYLGWPLYSADPQKIALCYELPERLDYLCRAKGCLQAASIGDEALRMCLAR
jgi:hypothetical protein